MMVARQITMGLQSPQSRGSSPGEKAASRNRGNSPDKRRSRGNSPEKVYKPMRSRGNSPGEKFTGASTLPRSRGSDSTVSDRLDQTMTPGQRRGLSPEDNINVVVRVRPLNSKETKTADESVIQFPGNGQIVLGAVDGSNKPRVFSYNVVFEPGATQEDVLQFSGIKRLIEMGVEGFSCTAFCYGQTGSGKTHTLTGPPGLFDRHPDPYSEDHGLVFRSFMYLFKLLQERSDFHFVLKASFLEIYNEKVIDLLNPGTARKPLAVRWSKKSRGFFVENLFTVDCEQLDDLLAVLEEGMRNRSVGRHNMNEYSSRSHTILTVHITSEQQMGEDGVFISKQGKINFVDLAGSEMTKKTHSEGKTLEEANNINKSLMVLGYCIASLSDSRKKGGHIPYRDSKLTKLLADSLAGNGVTLMIACISPARSNVSETVNTLRYAARAKKIRTKPIVMMDPREALILSLKREVSALQNENDHLRSALHLNGEALVNNPGQGEVEGDDTGNPLLAGRIALKTPPAVDLEKVAELEPSELSELVRHYMTENEALRRENSELFTTRELLIRDQELVCRENERLLKKLEDVNSVCCRSPIIPARPTYSAEMLGMSMSMNGNDMDIGASTNVWTNPLNGSITSIMSHSTSNTLPGPKFKNEILEGRKSAKPPHRLPDSIQKEMDRRGIGTSMTNIADSYRERSHRRHNSWDNNKPGSTSGGSADSTRSSQNSSHGMPKDIVSKRHTPQLRRMATAPNAETTTLPNRNPYRRASSLSNNVILNDIATSVVDNRRSIDYSDSLNFNGSGRHFSEALEQGFSESNSSLPDDHSVRSADSHKSIKENFNREEVESRSRRRLQSVNSDSELLPLRKGPYPDNDYADSSPGSLRTSPVSNTDTTVILGTYRKSLQGTPLPDIEPARRGLSSSSTIHSNKEDVFGSLVSLRDEDKRTQSPHQSKLEH